MSHRRSWKKLLSPFIPKLLTCIQEGYTLKILRGDLLAGLTVGIVALPVAMAFGIASGVAPAKGLFTSIVAGFLISFLGGSRVQISGAAGALVAVLYVIVEKQGYEAMVFATLLAGVILILSGFARLGNLIKYIPSPLIVGFTSGIAVTVFSSQLGTFFGLQIPKTPGLFLDQWSIYFRHASSWSLPTLLISLGTLLSILMIRRFVRVVPWAIGSIAFATLAVWWWDLPVQTIASAFGQLPSELPAPSLPNIAWTFDSIHRLFPQALTIAFLAGSKSLLSAMIADGLVGSRHKSNCELVAVGIGNIGSVLFGGIPASAVIARTAVSIKSGGTTPIAGMVHAFVMLGIISFAAPLMSMIPLAALAAILVVVAYDMCEKEKFFHLLKAPKGDVLVLLTAFFLTVLVDITVAVEVGMVLAAFLFMKRVSDTAKIRLHEPALLEGNGEDEGQDREAILKRRVPKGVEVFEIEGPFFFGTASTLRHILDQVEFPPKVFILRMRNVPLLDATAMEALKEFFVLCNKEKTRLVLSEVQPACVETLHKFGLIKKLGDENMCPTIDLALSRSTALIH